MDYVEVEPHRVLVVTLNEITRFTFYDEDGNVLPTNSPIKKAYRIVRDDNKVFKLARFIPIAVTWHNPEDLAQPRPDLPWLALEPI